MLLSLSFNVLIIFQSEIILMFTKCYTYKECCHKSIPKRSLTSSEVSGKCPKGSIDGVKLGKKKKE